MADAVAIDRVRVRRRGMMREDRGRAVWEEPNRGSKRCSMITDEREIVGRVQHCARLKIASITKGQCHPDRIVERVWPKSASGQMICTFELSTTERLASWGRHIRMQ